MIRRIAHIAVREWLEQTRQPVMLGVIAALYLIVGLLAVVTVGLVDHVAGDPGFEATLAGLVGTDDPQSFLELGCGTVVIGYNFLIFSQHLGIAAVLAGHSVLHERQCGTLTFLLLAPVRRGELLAGKVVGSIGLATALYYIVSLTTSWTVMSFEVTEAYADYLPSNPAWWVAFLLGGPLWALLAGTLCTIVSSTSRDVRTAQQGVWFIVFFMTLVAGFLLTNSLPQGALSQIAVAALAAVGCAGALVVGASVISRDLSR